MVKVVHNVEPVQPLPVAITKFGVFFVTHQQVWGRVDAAEQQSMLETLSRQTQRAAMRSAVANAGTSLCSSPMPEKTAEFAMTCGLNKTLMWKHRKGA